MMNVVDKVIKASGAQPRPYQRRIVHSAAQMFRGEYVNGAKEKESAASSVMIESPTGSGKTVMALLTAKTLQAAEKDLTIGWVAMRRNLLGQAAQENADMGINVSNAHWVSMFDKNPRELIAAKRRGNRLLLIVDEAQHDAANSMAHLHNILEPDMILGMTATPFRTDKVKLCFQKVIKDAGIHSLIQDGYLSPYHHYTLPQWNPKTVADHYCADPERWGKSIFYFKDLTQCQELAEILRARQVPLEFVTGSTDRDTQIGRFTQPVSEGGCDVLINCMVLTEGFNFPGLKTAWVRDSGKGCTMQMAGRAFRIHPDLPMKQIVQSKDTKWPFIRTAMPSQSFVWIGDEWRSLTVNPKLNEINQNARVAIATTDVELPSFVIQNRQRKSAATWRG
jgi:superfamily II DNA or RNA helicase